MEAFRNIVLFKWKQKEKNHNHLHQLGKHLIMHKNTDNLSQAKLGGASLDYGVGLYGKQFLIRLYNRTRAEVENMRENQQ